MKQRSRSQQQPDELTPEEGVQPVQYLARGETGTQAYTITGLDTTGPVVIDFGGRSYDLKQLTADELNYLLGFPGQVPYLKI